MSIFQAQAVAEEVLTDVDATKISSQCHIAACHPILLFYEIAYFQLKPISAIA
jgi:hypothetical protein